MGHLPYYQKRWSIYVMTGVEDSDVEGIQTIVIAFSVEGFHRKDYCGLQVSISVLYVLKPHLEFLLILNMDTFFVESAEYVLF